jgi:chemotaxis protein MotB
MLSRFQILCLFSLTFVVSGCAMPGTYVPSSELTAAQLRAQEIYAQSQELQAAHAGAQQMIAGLQSEQQHLSSQLTDTQERLTTANERVDNLLAERSELKERYANAIAEPYDDSILTNFGSEIPGFEFDAITGLYRFTGDIQFDLGSAELRPESTPVLKDFAAAVSGSEAAGHRILVVGHTDDLRILKGSTAAKHATNWHLSTNRADAVILELQRHGVDEERMAAMGYSKFQPLEASTDDSARQRNRRVELYLVPSSGQVAQWDPASQMN